MTSELTSTARPTGLRLAGFVCVALGAIAVGVGATRPWVSVGLAADLEHAADIPYHGTDVWEGKVVVFLIALALLILLAMRISASASTRSGLAIAGGILLVAGGVLSFVWAGQRARARGPVGAR